MTNKKQAAAQLGERGADFYDNFIGLDQEASIGADYIPKYFLRRTPSFIKHFTSPSVVIILEKNKITRALIYQAGLFRYKDEKGWVRHGELPKEFDDLVLKMLNHYNEAGFFARASEATKDLRITKSVASLFFNKKRYVIPLDYDGKSLDVRGEVGEIRNAFEKIFAEFISVVGDKADAYEHNRDLNALELRFKKQVEKEKAKLNITNFDF